MSLDLDYDDAQQSIAEAIGAFCRDRCPEAVVKATSGRFDAALWRALAELGVLGIATPEGEGGALELAAAHEALGHGVFPGPLAASVFAAQLLPEAERNALTRGETLVSVGAPPILPWANDAGIFIETDGREAWRATPCGEVTRVGTLAGEPWGRAELERGECLGGAGRALALYEIAAAAWLAGAGRRLVDETAEHVRTRRQFGRPIGEFQAVAHPLADCDTGIAGASALVRVAAYRFEQAGDAAGVGPASAAARLAATRSALACAYTAHQLFGALGATLEGPVFHVSRRIRGLASQAPGDGPAREALLQDYGL